MWFVLFFFVIGIIKNYSQLKKLKRDPQQEREGGIFIWHGLLWNLVGKKKKLFLNDRSHKQEPFIAYKNETAAGIVMLHSMLIKLHQIILSYQLLQSKVVFTSNTESMKRK